MGADQTPGLQTMQSYPATLSFKGKRKWTAHFLEQALILLHPDIVQAVSEYLLLLLLGCHRNAGCLRQPGFTGQLFGNAEKSVMLGQEERNKKSFWKGRKQELDKTTKQEPLWAQSVQTEPVRKAVCIHTDTSISRKTKSYLRVLLEVPLWKTRWAGTPHGEVFGKLIQLWQRRGTQ